MEINFDRLIKSIKEQVQLFLLNSGEFYPFDTSIDETNNIKPIGVYLENDNPSSSELINVLEKYIQKGIKNGQHIIAIIVIDVTIHQEGRPFDAIEMRIFERDKEPLKQYLKYKMHHNFVEFTE
ncbi:hypothetical protein [Rubrolithibacter danxiaensis]|uniref:hypothetical protein n=1 Tax=Rubrolithibacter danxiaensis TaxID=3390805 RepID=UPI003BF8E428